MKLNSLILMLTFLLLPVMAKAQTATNTATQTATQTATNTATQTSTNTATVTPTATFTFTPTPASIPGAYSNQMSKSLNNSVGTPVVVGPTGGIVNAGKTALGIIYKYWTILIQGTGGSGAVTVTSYPIPYPGGPASTTAVLTTTGAGNTSVVGITASPVPAWGMVSTVGVAAATTATIYSVGSN